MNILVIGGGGREHALCYKIAQSEKVDKIYCAPGNGGIENVAENVEIAVNDFEKLLAFSKEKSIDMVVVGPEDPLAYGIADLFLENGIKVFGPRKNAAMLEASKEFSKKFMVKYDIPTAKYESFTDYEKAISAIEKFSYPLVVKADGLCAGKGVLICKDKKEAELAIEEILLDKKFSDQGNKIVIEEFLEGIEASLLCIVSKNKLFPMESAKDYKRIYENDEGLNTGGVGCYSPNQLFTKDLEEKIKLEILDKISEGLQKENLEFCGVLFIGLMIGKEGPKVLEFNVRFGDPETEVVLPRLKSDLMEIFEKAIDGSLKKSDLVWKDEKCVTVVLTSEGYPEKYEKGKLIEIEKLPEEIILFHNGTKMKENKLYTNGGRVLSVTALGDSYDDAREKIYKNIDKIKFEGKRFRRDIAKF